jgi:cellobiose phosphorylase
VTGRRFLRYTHNGWRIVSLAAAGAGQEAYRSFMLAVVLEKP